MTDTSIITIGLIRGVLIALVLRYVAAYIDRYEPRHKLLKKLWKDDKHLRKQAIKYAWHIGVLIFLGHLAYALIFAA